MKVFWTPMGLDSLNETINLSGSNGMKRLPTCFSNDLTTVLNNSGKILKWVQFTIERHFEDY